MNERQDQTVYQQALADIGSFRLFTYLCFSPKDLHSPVFEVRPRVGTGQFSAEAACVHRYPGPYQIGVVCGRSIENPIQHLGRIQLLASFEDSAGRTRWSFEREMLKAGSVWWNGPANGFGLGIYAVPGEVPRNELLLCRVQILDLDGALAAYQPTALYSRNTMRK